MDGQRETRRAMRWSLWVAVFMLGFKGAAWWVTGSAAILADASESVVHMLAVAFAAFSLEVSQRPADSRFLFGYERISFFSAGAEGVLIILAAIGILFTALNRWLAGLELARLGIGTIFVAIAALINLALGWHLIRTGRRHHSLVLEANGKHVLTDCWTSAGVVLGLCLVLLTGWKVLDPLFAIGVAAQILFSGGGLIMRSFGGLLDYADPKTGREIHQKLDELSAELGVRYHGVRFRHAGRRVFLNLDLLFPFDTPVGKAHEVATAIEQRLPGMLGYPVEVSTHLESLEDHELMHSPDHFTG